MQFYAAEFQARCKMPTEDWPTFADDLKTLADKAYLDLGEDAHERLAVDRYLSQLEDPQLLFSVRQKQPATIDDTVTITMELQSHLKLAQTSAVQAPNFSVLAVSDKSRQPDRTIVLLEQLVSRMERLETGLAHSDQGRPQAPVPSPFPGAAIEADSTDLLNNRLFVIVADRRVIIAVVVRLELL